MSAVALCLDRRLQERVAAEAAASGHLVTVRAANGRELTAGLSGQRVEVAVVGGSHGRLTAEVVAACDRAGVRLVVLASSESERRHALSLGVHDALDAASDWEALEPSLRGVRAVPGRVGGPLSGADASRVIAVWGPAGAPGRTSLSIAIAAELASLGHTVALADADPYGGATAPSLGLLDEAPGFAAACRLAASGSLTLGELERVAQRYSSPRAPFWVLTGIGRASRWPELTADRVRDVLALCRTWVDYTVVDVGFSLETDEEITSDLFAPRRNAATLSTLGVADDVIGVGLADPVGLSRLLRSVGDLVDAAGGAPHVIVNRVRASAVGPNPFAQVAATLSRFGGIEAATLIPDDPAGFDLALLTGRTLRDVAPSSPARAAVRRFVERELAPVPEPQHGRRRGSARRRAVAERAAAS
ncbi:regulator [Humibacter ginsenosidimutans]|uniref:Regulator n=1 Tax=Humibacter ginsenosidimutans TaxID=2599293 RepID=A0A5B8M7U9_9MICO|nr:regulator [Humibacter ginsenosidimutans]QDZ16476.1 regulator [Humibacter ginsenosidimutans]